MFVQVQYRRKPFLPIATVSLALITSALFVYLALINPDERLRLLNLWGTIPHTIFNPPLQLDAFLIWLKQLVKPFTAITIHANALHLIGNLVFLLIFGIATERSLGTNRFLVLFLFCGAFAIVAGAWLIDQSNAPIIGASGAVSAIVGAYITLFPSANLALVLPLGLYLEFFRVPAVFLIGVWLILQLIFTFVGPAFGAVVWPIHLAGFSAGALFAMLSRPAIARRMRERS